MSGKDDNKIFHDLIQTERERFEWEKARAQAAKWGRGFFHLLLSLNNQVLRLRKTSEERIVTLQEKLDVAEGVCVW
jgi:hypothetical protein